ncbi:hypothetical protein BST61_g3276 [Cercospora zeina]
MADLHKQNAKLMCHTDPTARAKVHFFNQHGINRKESSIFSSFHSPTSHFMRRDSPRGLFRDWQRHRGAILFSSTSPPNLWPRDSAFLPSFALS